MYVVCYYDKMGNIKGKFDEHVHKKKDEYR